jgi:hypothetical protein
MEEVITRGEERTLDAEEGLGFEDFCTMEDKLLVVCDPGGLLCLRFFEMCVDVLVLLMYGTLQVIKASYLMLCLVSHRLALSCSIDAVSTSISYFQLPKQGICKMSDETDLPILGFIEEIEAFGVSVLMSDPTFAPLSAEKLVPTDRGLLLDEHVQFWELNTGKPVRERRGAVLKIGGETDLYNSEQVGIDKNVF